MEGSVPPQPEIAATYVSNPVRDPGYDAPLPDDPLDVIQRPYKQRRLDSSSESTSDESLSESDCDMSGNNNDFHRNNSSAEWERRNFEGYGWCWCKPSTDEHWHWDDATREWYIWTDEDPSGWVNAGNQYSRGNTRYARNIGRGRQNSYSSSSQGSRSGYRWHGRST